MWNIPANNRVNEESSGATVLVVYQRHTEGGDYGE